MRFKIILPLAAALWAASFHAHALEIDMSGKAGVQGQFFSHAPTHQEQDTNTASVFLSPEFSYAFEDNSDLITVGLHGRLDATDKERTHADIRELNYLKVAESGNWELKTGISTVFWGVAEGQNLVDVINQKDSLEGVATDEKLGQPMVQLTLLDTQAFLPEQDWGTLDLFVLPYFRKAAFPGKNGRFRPPIPVSNTRAFFESSQKENHIDYAGRWSHAIGPVDIGLSYFKGTNRTPSLVVELSPQILGTNTFRIPTGDVVPYYAQLEQFGLDIQISAEGFLFKLEAVNRNTNENFFLNPETGKPVSKLDIASCRNLPNTLRCPISNQIKDTHYTAYTVGGEYTFGDIAGSGIDVSLIAEYNKDSRNKETNLALLQNDVLLGTRLALNNANSTTGLFGLIRDLDYQSIIASAELETRLSNDISASIEHRSFITQENSKDPVLSQIENDDFTKISVEYFF